MSIMCRLVRNGYTCTYITMMCEISMHDKTGSRSIKSYIGKLGISVSKSSVGLFLAIKTEEEFGP